MTETFSTALLSKMVPDLKILRLLLPVLVMTALISALPAVSSLISKGVGALPGAAEAKVARAMRPATNFILERTDWMNDMIVEILVVMLYVILDGG